MRMLRRRAGSRLAIARARTSSSSTRSNIESSGMSRAILCASAAVVVTIKLSDRAELRTMGRASQLAITCLNMSLLGVAEHWPAPLRSIPCAIAAPFALVLRPDLNATLVLAA